MLPEMDDAFAGEVSLIESEDDDAILQATVSVGKMRPSAAFGIIGAPRRLMMTLPSRRDEDCRDDDSQVTSPLAASTNSPSSRRSSVATFSRSVRMHEQLDNLGIGMASLRRGVVEGRERRKDNDASGGGAGGTSAATTPGGVSGAVRQLGPTAAQQLGELGGTFISRFPSDEIKEIKRMMMGNDGPTSGPTSPALLSPTKSTKSSPTNCTIVQLSVPGWGDSDSDAGEADGADGETPMPAGRASAYMPDDAGAGAGSGSRRRSSSVHEEEAITTRMKRAAAFAGSDTNQDGRLDGAEVKKQLEKVGVGLDLTEEEIYKIISMIDTDGDHCLNREEFDLFAKLLHDADVKKLKGTTDEFLQEWVKVLERRNLRKQHGQARLQSLLSNMPVLTEGGLFNRYWDLIVMVLLLYVALSSSLVVAHAGSYSQVVRNADLGAFLVLAADVAITLSTAVKSESKTGFVSSRADIAHNYFRGRCWIDVVAVPWELPLYYITGIWQVWRWTKLKNLLYLLRWRYMWQVTDHGIVYENIILFYYMAVPLIRTMFKLVLFAHGLVLLRMHLASEDHRYACGVPAPEAQAADTCLSDSLGERYWLSAFWIWSIVISEGTITWSLAGGMVGCVAMCCALLFQSHVIAETFTLLLNASMNERNSEEMRMTLSAMMYFGVPLKVQQEALSFNFHTLELSSVSVLKQLLYSTPEPIMRELFLYIKLTVIEGVPLFNTLSQECCLALANCLVQTYASPEEVIIKFGAQGEEMYFLMYGYAEVTVLVGGQWRTVATLSRGDLFGEVALLKPKGCPRTATVAALTYCDMFLLRLQDFGAVQLRFPELTRVVTSEAIKRGLMQPEVTGPTPTQQAPPQPSGAAEQASASAPPPATRPPHPPRPPPPLVCPQLSEVAAPLGQLASPTLCALDVEDTHELDHVVLPQPTARRRRSSGVNQLPVPAAPPAAAQRRVSLPLLRRGTDPTLRTNGAGVSETSVGSDGCCDGGNLSILQLHEDAGSRPPTTGGAAARGGGGLDTPRAPPRPCVSLSEKIMKRVSHMLDGEEPGPHPGSSASPAYARSSASSTLLSSEGDGSVGGDTEGGGGGGRGVRSREGSVASSRSADKGDQVQAPPPSQPAPPAPQQQHRSTAGTVPGLARAFSRRGNDAMRAQAHTQEPTSQPQQQPQAPTQPQSALTRCGSSMLVRGSSFFRPRPRYTFGGGELKRVTSFHSTKPEPVVKPPRLMTLDDDVSKGGMFSPPATGGGGGGGGGFFGRSASMMSPANSPSFHPKPLDNTRFKFCYNAELSDYIDSLPSHGIMVAEGSAKAVEACEVWRRSTTKFTTHTHTHTGLACPTPALYAARVAGPLRIVLLHHRRTSRLARRQGCLSIRGHCFPPAPQARRRPILPTCRPGEEAVVTVAAHTVSRGSRCAVVPPNSTNRTCRAGQRRRHACFPAWPWWRHPCNCSPLTLTSNNNTIHTVRYSSAHTSRAIIADTKFLPPECEVPDAPTPTSTSSLPEHSKEHLPPPPFLPPPRHTHGKTKHRREPKSAATQVMPLPLNR